MGDGDGTRDRRQYFWIVYCTQHSTAAGVGYALAIEAVIGIVIEAVIDLSSEKCIKV